METSTSAETIEKLMQLNYLYAFDLQQLFNTIFEIATESGDDEKDQKISSLARIGSGLIDPYLFDELEKFLEELKKD